MSDLDFYLGDNRPPGEFVHPNEYPVRFTVPNFTFGRMRVYVNGREMTPARIRWLARLRLFRKRTYGGRCACLIFAPGCRVTKLCPVHG